MADTTDDKTPPAPPKKPPPKPDVFGYEAFRLVAENSSGKRAELAEAFSHRVNTGALVGEDVDALSVADVEAMCAAAEKAGVVVDVETTNRGAGKWGRSYLATRAKAS